MIFLKEQCRRTFNKALNAKKRSIFLREDFPQYAWSIRTLDRRLRHFGVYYNDNTVSGEDVEEAVKKELEGPGKLLGYRALHKKVRQKYDILVTRDQVYYVMI